MPAWLESGTPGFNSGLDALLARQSGTTAQVDTIVRDIIADVRAQGDEALLRLTHQFDRFEPVPGALAVTAAEIAAATASIPPATLGALELAASRIESFHRRQLPRDDLYQDSAGATLGMRWTPIDAVGLYVPGGQAAYPSSVLMNAIPARIAGVRRLVMVSPTPQGFMNPLVLAAASLAGVHEIYRIGGAQAVAALAFGTSTIRPVDKIVGPGNAFVAEAKRQVFGHVGIDSIAGPSEVLIIADAANNPEWIAADLLAQAEHDEEAQSILITDSVAFARSVSQAVDGLLTRLGRAAIAGRSWAAHGGIVVVRSLDEAPAIANRIAPEHLQLCTADPAALAAQIRHAGAIFLGATTPEAIGDYVGGPNHVLPTSGSARFSSGLSVLDFMKRTTILSTPPGALEAIGPAASLIADAEGLDAHALSVRMRLQP
jgi:histidinol dehydrogenase